MKTIIAFFRLARWSNLVFLALTQWLFIYCIVLPIFNAAHYVPNIHGYLIFCLIISYSFVAGGGYIINDYFDLNIDQINKPEKVMIDRYIGRRWAIILHFLFSFISICIGVYVDFQTDQHILGGANLFNAILVFVYSLSLKKKLLAGNIVIAFLLAWAIVVITCCEINQFLLPIREQIINTQKLLRYTFLYAGFAFIGNIIREVIKDMEDVEGDRKYGCRTMPIAWGMNASKVFVSVWLVMLIGILSILLIYSIHIRWYLFSLYGLLLIVIPLIVVFKKMFAATNAKDYHDISFLMKIVMFTGILSMFFFRIYGQ